MFADYNDIVTVQDIAKMLSMKEYKVYELIKNGKIRRLNTGKPYIVPKSEVVRFVEESIIEQ